MASEPIGGFPMASAPMAGPAIAPPMIGHQAAERRWSAWPARPMPGSPATPPFDGTLQAQAPTPAASTTLPEAARPAGRQGTRLARLFPGLSAARTRPRGRIPADEPPPPDPMGIPVSAPGGPATMPPPAEARAVGSTPTLPVTLGVRAYPEAQIAAAAGPDRPTESERIDAATRLVRAESAVRAGRVNARGRQAAVDERRDLPPAPLEDAGAHLAAMARGVEDDGENPLPPAAEPIRIVANAPVELTPVDGPEAEAEAENPLPPAAEPETIRTVAARADRAGDDEVNPLPPAAEPDAPSVASLAPPAEDAEVNPLPPAAEPDAQGPVSMAPLEAGAEAESDPLPPAAEPAEVTAIAPLAAEDPGLDPLPPASELAEPVVEAPAEEAEPAPAPAAPADPVRTSSRPKSDRATRPVAAATHATEARAAEPAEARTPAVGPILALPSVPASSPPPRNTSLDRPERRAVDDPVLSGRPRMPLWTPPALTPSEKPKAAAPAFPPTYYEASKSQPSRQARAPRRTILSRLGDLVTLRALRGEARAGDLPAPGAGQAKANRTVARPPAPTRDPATTPTAATVPARPAAPPSVGPEAGLRP